MGINDTTTQTHSGGCKCLEAIYHNSTTSTHSNSTVAKKRPWAEKLTSVPKRGSGSRFLLLAVRKSREPGNEARGRGLRPLNDKMFTATRCSRSKYNFLTTSGFEVGSRWQQNSEQHHVTVSMASLRCARSALATSVYAKMACSNLR